MLRLGVFGVIYSLSGYFVGEVVVFFLVTDERNDIMWFELK